jgi:delta 1-pyrroline-5-carboxylate dehydrogenase
MAGEIVTAIQEAAAKHPEQAAQLAKQAKAQWATLSPGDKQQVLSSLKDVQMKATNLSDVQRKEIATAISSMA